MADNQAGINAIAAIRVSTVRQGVDGDSPDAQKEQIERFAENNNLTIKKYFVFLESASKDQQPMQEAIDYCKNPKNNIQQFVVKSIDRFTRGGSYSYDHLKMQLEGYGVSLVDIYGVISAQKINTLDHLGVEYNWSVYSPSKKSEILEAERAKDEMRDIMSRMIGAEVRYTRMGYYMRQAPFGYKSVKLETQHGKRTILKPHQNEAMFIKKLFDLRCQGTLSDQDIIAEVNRLGFKTRVRFVRDKHDRSRVVGEHGGKQMTIKDLPRYLQKPLYAGVNCEKWTLNKPVRSKFDGLVSIDDFNKANRGKIVIGQDEEGAPTIYKRKPPEHLANKRFVSPDFPYKRIVMCPNCKRPLLGSASRGKMGIYYPAYHCDKRGHYFRVPKSEFDATIDKFVHSIHFSPKRLDELEAALLAEWEKRQASQVKDDINFDAKIAELKTQAKLAVDKIKYLQSETAIKYMEEDLLRIEDQIAHVTAEKASTKAKGPVNMKQIMASIRYYIEHLDYLLLQQSNTISRAAFFSVLFNKAPTYEELKSGTQNKTKITGLNEFFTLQNVSLDTLVTSRGIEPRLSG